MLEKLIRFLVLRSGQEHSRTYRAVATVCGATLFLAGWPALVGYCGKLPGGAVLPSDLAWILGLDFFICGIPWLVWAIVWQWRKGQGTPVPVVPTRIFLPDGPYRFCRNPMMFGFFCYLSGWAAIFNRPGAYAGASLIMALLLVEIITVEEKELAERFGDAYLHYKKETSFFFPELPRKKAQPAGLPQHP
ncbi:MAG: isoprenylcysteine carboxylmethyltransferase family protein [Candidatus Omnitrophica bacterium]|nr:isoprenylcysteine carboxylmethyltransferase family protein [Candidatus Omnitrophota bacterium]